MQVINGGNWEWRVYIFNQNLQLLPVNCAEAFSQVKIPYEMGEKKHIGEGKPYTSKMW